jgi:hypothetical protein
MIAKQYTVGLPADYDMGIIRRRVEEKGSAYDTFPGLYLKAFLIRERRWGAICSEYAPFYLWPTTDAMWKFVAGDGFRGIVESFCWTPIHTWFTLTVSTRPGLQPAKVRSATRELSAILPGTNLTRFRESEETDDAALLMSNARLAARVVAVNIEHWQLVRFALWLCPQEDIPAEPGCDKFEVLRLSAPGLR